MAGPVCDKTDEVSSGTAFNLPEALVQIVADEVDHLNVLFFALAPDIVAFSQMSLVKNRHKGLAMVIHVDPVADVSSIAVYREIPAFCGIEDNERNQLFGELKGAVVIGAVGDNRRQPIGPMKGFDHVVRGSLACRVGAGGVIGGCLRRIHGSCDRTIHFVGRNVKKALLTQTGNVLQRPESAASLQEVEGAQNIGAHKNLRTEDASIHMGFGGKMNNPVDFGCFKQMKNKLLVGEIPFDKSVTAGKFLLHVREICKISRIGEEIHVQDFHVPMNVKKMSDEIAADEAGAACNKSSHMFLVHSFMNRTIIVLTLLFRILPSGVIASPALSGVAISQLEQRDCFTAFAMTFQSILL
jgi:hypothetical protein